MTVMSGLLEAKRLADEGKVEEAASLYRQCIEVPSERAIACYSLGIIFSYENSPVANEAEAEKYFLLASKEDYPMATYALAGLLLRRGDIPAALKAYKEVAATNPSAAYWASRILSENAGLSQGESDIDRYLDLAARQGHIHAKKTRALQRLKGQRGITGIPKGLADLLCLIFEARKAVANNDKLRYQ